MTFSWRKHGLVFDPRQVTDRPFLHEFAQAPAVLLFDDFVRVYFSCRPRADECGQYVSYTTWLDLDRRDLLRVLRVAKQPILPLGALGCFDEFGVYPVSIIRDGGDVRAYYGGWTRCESVPFNVAIGLAISRDGGDSFTRAGPGPVLSYSPEEPFIVSGPKIRRFNDAWYLFYIAGKHWLLDNGRPEPVYRIRLAVSQDGETWKRVNRDLIETRLGPDEAQASPDVFECGERFHMFFCYRHGTQYRNRQRGYRIGYAYSSDLLHWTRDDDRSNLTVSDDGFDSEMVCYPHVFSMDGAVYMLYLGNSVGRFGFGLAQLERQ